MAYTALVTRLQHYKKDENSDRLYLGDCYGEGVIVGEDFTENERVLYMPTDGRLERWFGNDFNLFRKNEDGTPQGGYLEDNGHIKAIKLRGNMSSGIVLKLSAIYEKYGDQGWLEDMEVTQINGKTFVSKYIPLSQNNWYQGQRTSMKGKKANNIQYPEFDMHIDTAQLAYNLDQFHEGDQISISVKMHGTSQRSMKTYGIIPNHGVIGFFRNLLHLGPRRKNNQYVLGTRRTVKYENSRGFYPQEDFRWKHHERIKPFIEDGMEVFYEVCGWYGSALTNTIMPIGDNRKLKDPTFIETFGDTTIFSYGCNLGESEMFVYRITGADGHEYSPAEIEAWCEKAGVKHVPYVQEFTFTTQEDLMERVSAELSDLVDPIGGHLKEGVVVRILNRRKFEAYKAKTFAFKVLEGLIKDSEAAPDMEEAQE